MGLTPNLDDYDRVRATFTWTAARAELEGLPEGRGLTTLRPIWRFASGSTSTRWTC